MWKPYAPRVWFIVEQHRGGQHRPKHADIPNVLPILLHPFLSWREGLYAVSISMHDFGSDQTDLFAKQPSARFVVVRCAMRRTAATKQCTTLAGRLDRSQ